MSSKIKFLIFLGFNLFLFIVLYNISISSEILDNICLIKRVTGKNCWNCGMTRAFLSIIHLDFCSAYKFNHKVFVVFPFTIGIYLYSWLKYIFVKGENVNE